MHTKGSQVIISKRIAFPFSEGVFAKSVVPDEMLHYA